MGSIGLISFLVALVTIPVISSRRRDPRAGLRLMVGGLLLASLCYAAFAAFIFSPFYPPENW